MDYNLKRCMSMGDSGQQHTEITIVDKRTLHDKIYTIREVKVMLDFELAEIYGYMTRAFNQQIKRNQERFPEDFRFCLTLQELEDISRSQIVILNKGT